MFGLVLGASENSCTCTVMKMKKNEIANFVVVLSPHLFYIVFYLPVTGYCKRTECCTTLFTICA
jgi:hypothetical protein